MSSIITAKPPIEVRVRQETVVIASASGYHSRSAKTESRAQASGPDNRAHGALPYQDRQYGLSTSAILLQKWPT